MEMFDINPCIHSSAEHYSPPCDKVIRESWKLYNIYYYVTGTKKVDQSHTHSEELRKFYGPSGALQFLILQSWLKTAGIILIYSTKCPSRAD